MMRLSIHRTARVLSKRGAFALLAALLEKPEVRDQLPAQGFEPVGSSPAEFAGQLAAEIAKWKRVVAETGVRPD